MATLLITGADPARRRSPGPVVEDGVITEVGSIRSAKGADVLDADGLVALPGLVDLHTHLREPGREDAETIASGAAAAAVGGFTAILAMANTSPVTDTAEAAERILDLGRATGLVDVVPVGAVTKGLDGEELAELGLMHRSRAAVTVFSDDGHCVHDARVMRRALEYVRAFGGVVSQHAQDPHLAGPERLLPTRASSPVASGCPAGPASPRSRSWPATSCWPATPVRGCTSPTSPPPAPSR